MFQFGSQGRSRTFMTNREQYRLAALVVVATLGAVIAGGLVRPERWGKVLWRETATSVDSVAMPAATQDDSYFPGVSPPALERVRDDWPFRDDDREAYFNLFDVLAKNDPSSLEKTAVRATFAQLRKQSVEYRGRLVSVSGKVRRNIDKPFPKNDVGLQTYHQLWVQLDDAPDWPVTVHCLDLPKGFPTGQEIEAPAKITGFFFKRMAYMSGDGMRTAPTLLARTVGWQPPPPAPEPAAEISLRSLVILGVGSVAIFAWMIVWYRRRRVQPPQWMPARWPDFEGIQSHGTNEEESS